MDRYNKNLYEEALQFSRFRYEPQPETQRPIVPPPRHVLTRPGNLLVTGDHLAIPFVHSSTAYPQFHPVRVSQQPTPLVEPRTMSSERPQSISAAEIEWRNRGHGLQKKELLEKIPISHDHISLLTTSSRPSSGSSPVPPPLLTVSSRPLSPEFRPPSQMPATSQVASLSMHSNTRLSPEYPPPKGRRISSATSRPAYSPQRPSDSPLKTITLSAQRSIFRERTTHPLSKGLSSTEQTLVMVPSTLSSSEIISRTTSVPPTPANAPLPVPDVKDMSSQAGGTMVVTPASKQTKRTSSFLDQSESAPPPKTVRIAPFNIQPTPTESGGSSPPEALTIVSGGTATVCHPHPVPASSVPPARLPQVRSGERKFINCIPASCAGTFAPRRSALQHSNCKCHAHIKAQTLLKRNENSKGSKSQPVIIDSDDEEIQIIKDVPATPDSAAKGTKTAPTPTKDAERKNTSLHISPQEHVAQSKRIPLSPRQRAKMSADHNKGANIVPPQEEPKVSDSSDLESLGLSLANVVSKMSKRMRMNEQTDGNISSGSSTSDSLPTLQNLDLSAESLLSNPEKLVKMIQDIKKVRPYKRLRVTGRNLFQAVKTCNLEKVIALLVEGCRANSQVEAEKGRTALHAAAAGGYMDIMKVLRMVGADLDVLDYDMRTPLFDAVENHQLQAIDYLMRAGASLKVKDQAGMTLLHLASRRGHTDLITRLLDTGLFDINQKDDGGWTSIMWAAEDKHANTTKLLIQKGGSVHLRDLELNIPLHWAAFAGSEDIALLLLNEFSDANSVNKHGETPLHIATREDNFSCVQLLLNRGARIDIKNKNAMTPVEVAYAGTRSQKLLEANKMLLLCQPKGRYRLLSCDISRGQENVAIPCINEVDDEPIPQFHFVKESCEVGGSAIQWNIDTIESCSCEGDCRNGVMCQCANHSALGKIWYTQDGLLSSEIHKLDRPLIFECNRLCKCWSYCRNRVVQKGLQYPLQLYKTKRKGWGVRALCPIPLGTFLCEYTGELISDSEADLRNDDTFLFDLDCKESDQELFCIDAAKFGNISRFINHSCEPNCVPTRVFINHQDIRFPRIAFFSSKDIEIYQEICFDYGDRFWEVKKDEFFCECGTSSCNYKNPNL